MPRSRSFAISAALAGMAIALLSPPPLNAEPAREPSGQAPPSALPRAERPPAVAPNTRDNNAGRERDSARERLRPEEADEGPMPGCGIRDHKLELIV